MSAGALKPRAALQCGHVWPLVLFIRALVRARWINVAESVYAVAVPAVEWIQRCHLVLVDLDLLAIDICDRPVTRM